MALAACLMFSGFVALGNWQLERRVWKLDLIERVNQRVHAAPEAAPAQAAWPNITVANDEYRHVRVSGHYNHADTVLVRASSYEGYGYWMLTPLQTTLGFSVLVNRGFLPADLPHQKRYQSLPRPQGRVVITGLLRLSEPEGTFLRANKPEQGRWYSRDVQAIAASKGLSGDSLAPYFIDADAGLHPEKYPAGGLTVIDFRNTHLVYALTWYGLASLVVIAGVIVGRYEWRARKNRLHF